MIVGITGTRYVARTNGGYQRVKAAISQLPSGTMVVTGACVGADAAVARFAKNQELTVFTVVPFQRDQVDPAWKEWCDGSCEMPDGTSYRDRNEEIVKMSQLILAFPAWPEDDPRSRRSGTWMTVRIARRAGVPVEIIPLWEEDDQTDA